MREQNKTVTVKETAVHFVRIFFILQIVLST